eukprot:366510-Chlamydomonas_euryale.AAC.14
MSSFAQHMTFTSMNGFTHEDALAGAKDGRHPVCRACPALMCWTPGVPSPDVLDAGRAQPWAP